jgi:ectoine hydroxylase-related dioxygenase (phytanoyl-CoA dioxygenase family)
MRAGDATIHHCLTVHSAPENLTDTPRWVLLASYMPGDALYNGRPGNLAIEKAELYGWDLEVGKELPAPIIYP